MAQAPLKDVVAHWHKLFEDLQTTPLGFYSTVEEALERREIPGLCTSRIEWNEGGLLSPRRQYLRVTGELHVFDICAAPFGAGFFFSSWVTPRKARFVALYVLVFIGSAFGIVQALTSIAPQIYRHTPYLLMFLYPVFQLVFTPIVLFPLAVLIVLSLIALVARTGEVDPANAVRTIPLIGWVYEQLFARETYYRVDTMLMFQSAVHTAMLEAIDQVTAQKGVRGLSADERKPIFNKLT